MEFPAARSQQITHEMSLASSWDKTRGTEDEKNLDVPEITMEQTGIISSGDLPSGSGVVINPDWYLFQYPD